MVQKLNVYGNIYVKKKPRLIHLGEVESEEQATKLATEFLRTGLKQGVARSAKCVDEEGNTLFFYGVEEPKATTIQASELDLLEKGYKVL